MDPGETSDNNEPDNFRHHQPVVQEYKQKIYKKYRIRACLDQCKYNIVHDLIEDRKWKECCETDDWNICWNDWSILLDRVLRMKAYEKINHFPGMNEITRKDTLARNMNKVRKLCPEEYNIFPVTFQIPQDSNDFRYFYEQNKDKKVVYISKPIAGCQGRGIKLFRNVENIDLSEPQVVEEYIAKPYLINGYKFDLRTYVIVIQVVPFLQLIYYEDGMARFCTELYEEPSGKNLKKAFMHLTNYAINKQNTNFEYNSDEDDDDTGSKWGLSAVWDHMKADGIDVDEFKRKMWDIEIKTVISILPSLQHAYTSARPTQPRFGDSNPYDSLEPYFGSSCFEILGFDIMITSDGQPVLIEVNHSPSFRCDTPLDLRIKEGVISGTLDMLWIEQDDKILYGQLEKASAMKRLYGKHENRVSQVPQLTKKGKISKGIKTLKQMPTFASIQQHIQLFLQQHSDRFKQIYPLPVNTPDPYEAIYQKVKNPHAKEAVAPDIKSVPRGLSVDTSNIKAKQSSDKNLESFPKQQRQQEINSNTNKQVQKDSILMQKNEESTASAEQIEPVQEQFDVQAVERRPQSAKPGENNGADARGSVAVSAELDNNRGSAIANTTSAENDELPISPHKFNQNDPMEQILKRAMYEIEYGIDTKQIAFRGIQSPTLLPQGALRNDKIEKQVEQDLCSKMRAMIKFGIREQVEALIRQGQRNQSQNYNQPPAEPQRIDVFEILGSNNRSKSIANQTGKLQIMKPYYKNYGKDDIK